MERSEAVIGVVSLIFWSLILIVSLKYAILILRADNRGEGGIVAMLAVLRARHARSGTWRGAILIVGLVGAALLYGDGTITPAISVLSAVEGLKVDAPGLSHFVIPLTLVILVGLFLVQRRGSGFIGGLFGPVMLAWFIVLGILGARGIVLAPDILAAISPVPALTFIIHAPPLVGFAVLGATFLAVTGGEAMYADMGHFGRMPIRVAWFAIVLPALVLNYFGQGALLLSDPQAAENPFFRLAPEWFHYPLVAFAAIATVIASEAIITGAFSLTQQAIQLGFLPRLSVFYTASAERGQIYVPLVNWTLALATLSAVLLFGSSEALAGAYGIAVSLLMAITTVLAGMVAFEWRFNRFLVIAVNGFFLCIDLVFVAANSIKVFDGGWFPLLLAAGVAFLMLTWRAGRRLTERTRSRTRESEGQFIARLLNCPPVRLRGTAAFLASGTVGIPLTLTQHLKHLYALPEHVLLVTVLTSQEPRIRERERVDVRELCAGLTRVTLRFGFMETPSVPEVIRYAQHEHGLACGALSKVSYYLGRETIIPTKRNSGMRVWRKAVYAFMLRNAERSAAYFCIPAVQVVEIGMEIEL